MSQRARPHHLWGMVGELVIERGIAADTLSDAAAGDALALARIVEAYHDDMARLCFVICGDRDTAQEAVRPLGNRVAEARIAARSGESAGVADDDRRERGSPAAPPPEA